MKLNKLLNKIGQRDRSNYTWNTTTPVLGIPKPQFIVNGFNLNEVILSAIISELNTRKRSTLEQVANKIESDLLEKMNIKQGNTASTEAL